MNITKESLVRFPSKCVYNKLVTTYDYELMRDTLAENDSTNYAFAHELGKKDLYQIIRKGIKGYDNMTDDEIVSTHFDVFGYVDYK